MAVMRKLPPSLVAKARLGRVPIIAMPREMTAKTGLASATASSSPATTRNSLLSAATSGRPKTGAPTNPCLRVRCSSSRRSANWTLIVDMET